MSRGQSYQSEIVYSAEETGKMISTRLLLVLLITFSACASVDVTVDIGSFPDGIWKISPYLASMSLVYAWAPGSPFNATMKILMKLPFKEILKLPKKC